MATLGGKDIPYPRAIVPDVGVWEGGGVPRLNRLKPPWNEASWRMAGGSMRVRRGAGKEARSGDPKDGLPGFPAELEGNEHRVREQVVLAGLVDHPKQSPLRGVRVWKLLVQLPGLEGRGIPFVADANHEASGRLVSHVGPP
jgi:hypothetical protein